MGLLREKLNVKPFYLNLRYSYDDTNYLRWLQDYNKPANLLDRPMPYLFVKLNTTKWGWQDTSKRLWEKTIQVHLIKNGNKDNLSVKQNLDES